MLFSSVTFLYYFLPAVLIVYHALPMRWKNGALLLASLVFYAWGEPKYVFLMLAMILLGYVCGREIEAFRGRAQGKAFLWISLTVSIGVLFLFKYAGLELALPVGISFYTFQLISYLIDVDRANVPAQRSFVDLAAYVTCFPQLIAGPIVRYSDIEKQLRERSVNAKMLLSGVERFVIGLGKKVLLANGLGELCALFRASGEPSVLFYWMYAVSFTLQIYFDFSGYSDMAIGLGEFFGFTFLENFDYPYVSKSITEFWRRWHISLGNWFRDYVYIPLGGNRVSRGKWYRNILIVWALTGLWHGAAWNFPVWGLYFAVLLIVEKRWLLKKLEKATVWNHCYVLFFVTVSFVIFNADGIGGAASDLAGMFGLGGLPLVSAESLYYLKSYAVTLSLAAVGATPLVKLAAERSCVRKLLPVLKPLVLAGIFLTVTAYLIDGSYNPFLYFRF